MKNLKLVPKRVFRLFFSTTILFVLVSALMTFIYFQKESNYKAMTSLSKSCITSFVNAVDYSLCLTDYRIGNVKFATCDNYASMMTTDMKYVRTIWYDNNYNYIWN